MFKKIVQLNKRNLTFLYVAKYNMLNNKNLIFSPTKIMALKESDLKGKGTLALQNF